MQLEAPPVGPGTYDTEAPAHKELMTALYPKKGVPFNASDEKRVANPSSPKLDKPGEFSFLCNGNILTLQ